MASVNRNPFNGKVVGYESPKQAAPAREERKADKPSKNTKKPEREQYVPQVTEEAKAFANAIRDQVVEFMDAQAQIAEMDTAQRKAAELALYHIGAWPTALEFDNGDGNRLMCYLLDRSVRTDRTTHLLTRASCAIVALKDGVPAYFLSSYLTHTGSGNIIVLPMGENGPVYRDAYKLNITDGKFEN